MSNQRGYSLIEMLVSTAVMTVIVGGVFQLVNPAHGTSRVQPEYADVQQRARIGADMLFKDLVKQAYMGRVSLSATGYYRTPKIHYDRETASGRPFLYFAYGAAVSEVMIDILTGEYTLTRVDILHDAGKSLNPAIDLGQVEGGFIQGMGWLTSEDLVFDEQGRLRSQAPSTSTSLLACHR